MAEIIREGHHGGSIGAALYEYDENNMNGAEGDNVGAAPLYLYTANIIYVYGTA